MEMFLQELKLVFSEAYHSTTSIKESENEIVSSFLLDQNYPNPFNPSTTIEYFIPSDGFVSLTIFNAIGQEVSILVNERQSAGKYTVSFNSAEASGCRVVCTFIRFGAEILMQQRK